jgi:hypothetical protein
MNALAEAAVPAVRELLVWNHACACKTEQHKVHAVNRAGRPICGGGRNARAATAWQGDIGPVTCEHCLAIINGRNV